MNKRQMKMLESCKSAKERLLTMLTFLEEEECPKVEAELRTIVRRRLGRKEAT
jgi:hypothetical protein